MSEKVIDSILKTYRIPRELKDKISQFTSKKIDASFIGSYSEIYDYISYLVDQFQTPYEERFFTRLDLPKYENSSNLYHEFLSSEEEEWAPPIKKSSQNDISISDMYLILEDYLDKASFSLFKQLQFEEGVQLNISEEFLLESVPKIKKNLERLVKKNKGGLFIQKRPIIQIQPIKFGRRNYNGDPLAFFNSHIGSYKGLIRSKLLKLDSGLYTSLVRWNQIDVAIPKITPPGASTKLKEEKINAIIESYQNCKIVQRVAKEHGVSRSVVDKYLIKKGLKEPRKKRGTYGYPQKKIDKIIKAYDKCKIASQVAKKFGVCRFTITKHWRKEGFKITSRGNSKERIEYYNQK